MAVIAAPGTGAISPQVAAQIVTGSNNIQPIAMPSHVIGAPTIYPAPRSTPPLLGPLG